MVALVGILPVWILECRGIIPLRLIVLKASTSYRQSPYRTFTRVDVEV